jgi:hypothetical protein
VIVIVIVARLVAVLLRVKVKSPCWEGSPAALPAGGLAGVAGHGE